MYESPQLMLRARQQCRWGAEQRTQVRVGRTRAEQSVRHVPQKVRYGPKLCGAGAA